MDGSPRFAVGSKVELLGSKLGLAVATGGAYRRRMATETATTRRASMASYDDLASRLRGDPFLPDSPGYDAAGRIWNGAIARRPACIARCSGVADVVEAVRFARHRELLVAVRSGGHGVGGHALCDDGLVI